MFCANFLFKIIKLLKSSVIYQEKLSAVVFFPTLEEKTERVVSKEKLYSWHLPKKCFSTMSDFLEFHKISFKVSSFPNLIFEIMLAFRCKFPFQNHKTLQIQHDLSGKVNCCRVFPNSWSKIGRVVSKEEAYSWHSPQKCFSTLFGVRYTDSCWKLRKACSGKKRRSCLRNWPICRVIIQRWKTVKTFDLFRRTKKIYLLIFHTYVKKMWATFRFISYKVDYSY